MNRSLLIVLVVSAIVGLVGCGVTGTSSTSGYFPHQDGYQWIYKCVAVIGTEETNVMKETRYFSGTTVLPNGLTAQNMIVSQEAGAFAVKALAAVGSYYYVNENGVYTYGSSGHPTTEGMLIIPLPLEVGKKWNRGEMFTCEAVAVEDVTVLAGTFNAIKIQADGGDYCEWYADKVGLVKTFIDNVYFTITTGEVIRLVSGSYVQELVSKSF
jgi:hypothetical protein